MIYLSELTKKCQLLVVNAWLHCLKLIRLTSFNSFRLIFLLTLFSTFSHFYLIYLIHICMVSSPYKVISTFRNALSYPHNNQCHFLDSSKQEMVCGCHWEFHPVDSPIWLDTQFDELRPKNDFWLSLGSPWMKKMHNGASR